MPTWAISISNWDALQQLAKGNVKLEKVLTNNLNVRINKEESCALIDAPEEGIMNLEIVGKEMKSYEIQEILNNMICVSMDDEPDSLEAIRKWKNVWELHNILEPIHNLMKANEFSEGKSYPSCQRYIPGVVHFDDAYYVQIDKDVVKISVEEDENGCLFVSAQTTEILNTEEKVWLKESLRKGKEEIIQIENMLEDN